MDQQHTCHGRCLLAANIKRPGPPRRVRTPQAGPAGPDHAPIVHTSPGDGLAAVTRPSASDGYETARLGSAKPALTRSGTAPSGRAPATGIARMLTLRHNRYS